MKMRALTGLGLIVIGGLAGCERGPGTPTSKSSPPKPSVSPSLPVRGSASTEAGVPLPSEMMSALQGAGLGTSGFVPKWMSDCRERLWARPVTRAEAVELRATYRRQTDATGYYPVLFVDGQKLLLDAEPKKGTSAREHLLAAATIDATTWLAGRVKETLSDGEEKPRAVDFAADDGKATDADEFALPGSTVVGEGEWWLLLLPTRSPWQAFAYVGYGGWNAYPMCEEHIAVMKHWHERFGAEPVIVSGDCIEMSVARPPVEKEACRALAMEQFGYTAGDIVYQGYERFGTFARVLQGRRHWFFWWD